MSNVIDCLDGREDVFHLEGVTDEEIERAEKELGLKFAEDYKMLLRKFGIVSYGAHELTGIGKITRLNVINVTEEEKKINTVPEEYYVIEELNIDGIVIWQNKTGEIFQSIDKQFFKIYDSLEEYICNED